MEEAGADLHVIAVGAAVHVAAAREAGAPAAPDTPPREGGPGRGQDPTPSQGSQHPGPPVRPLLGGPVRSAGHRLDHQVLGQRRRKLQSHPHLHDPDLDRHVGLWYYVGHHGYLGYCYYGDLVLADMVVMVT